MTDSTVTGLDQLLEFLDDSPKKVQHGLHVGLLAGAELIEAAAKANCPVHLGELRDSIHASIKESGTKVIATVTAGGTAPNGIKVWYAHLIEFTGAVPHEIKANNGGALSFGGHEYKVIHHPGMQAKPFLRPALDVNEVAAIGLVDQQIDDALNGK